MSQNLFVNDFKWVEDISEFNEDFMKAIIMKVLQDIFLKLIFSILKM